jgi:hypothetical protein
MTFDSSLFWPVFKATGMLTEVAYQPPAGALVIFDAGYSRPDQVVLDGMVHSTDHTIEYQRADVDLKRDELVDIGGISFRVRQTPLTRGDGTFSVAILEEVVP